MGVFRYLLGSAIVYVFVGGAFVLQTVQVDEVDLS